MHQVNFDLSLEEISKIEGAASLDLSVKDNQVAKCQFKITEYKRFYTQAIKGKAAVAAPALLARICGTCSNAHILAAIKAVEAALQITPSAQTLSLRRLVNSGLIIRDHALHLYVFVLPDLFNQDSLLDFDENDQAQHQLLHDAFQVKEAGNQLSILAGGRSVHAPYPMVGGFMKFPEPTGINKVIKLLEASRPAVERLIKVFSAWPKTQAQTIPYLAYIDGRIKSSDGLNIAESDYRSQLQKKQLDYSQASAYTYKAGFYMTGALARLNLTPNPPAPFPSNNVYHNNLAQAVEILQAIDDSIAILKQVNFTAEPMVKPSLASGDGIGVIEAPRGILYHHLTITNGVVTDAEILVPTGQNQLNIENDIKILVEDYLRNHSGSEKSDTPGVKLQAQLAHEIEVLVRAYDPCMSCAAHFLKINWLPARQ
ncbi:MAG: nickel-dependent hydrogenase large subunit [Patescibacteria group bacterium]|nr:nickel-dependent hydrogenase large subunit [Candidatus Beckwithbacteria bacterium]MDZ4229072.1 nickel-dependent hydrogenase large subunit [Patescibacteria group bacterium]